MASLYGQYIKERLDKNILEDKHGFATYYFDGAYCYIEDIFVVEEKRTCGVAAQLADKITEIAKQKNCLALIGSVKPSANGSTTSVKVLLAYGFKLFKAQEDFVWFKKDLEV